MTTLPPAVAVTRAPLPAETALAHLLDTLLDHGHPWTLTGHHLPCEAVTALATRLAHRGTARADRAAARLITGHATRQSPPCGHPDHVTIRDDRVGTDRAWEAPHRAAEAVVKLRDGARP